MSGLGEGRTVVGLPNRFNAASEASSAGLVHSVRSAPVLLVLLAIALNQTAVVAGVNLSLSDLFVLGLALALALNRNLVVPTGVALFWLFSTSLTLITAMFITPLRFDAVPSLAGILVGLIKVGICLVFLVCGVSVARLGHCYSVVRWFAWGAVAIAAGGLILFAAGIHTLDPLLYENGVRLRGLMSDPNFYAVLNCAGIAFFLRDRGTRLWLRVLASAVLGAAVLLSGSKTGLVIVAALLLMFVAERVLRRTTSPILSTGLVGLLVFVAFYWSSIEIATIRFAAEFGQTLPQLRRLADLMQSGTGAVAEGGSNRISTWGAALAVISASPLVGVGIGLYVPVAMKLTDSATVAHNTYLQLGAEWGLPLTVVFCVWLLWLVARTSQIALRTDRIDILAARDIVVVFIIGSFSISLNNARMFWLFVGMLIAITMSYKTTGDANRSLVRNEPLRC